MNRGPTGNLHREEPGVVPIGSHLEGGMRHDAPFKIRLGNIPFIIGHEIPWCMMQIFEYIPTRHLRGSPLAR